MKHYCERCGRKLDETKIVWLEYDQRDGTYHNRGDIPAEYNQGGFAFGADCAATEMRRA